MILRELQIENFRQITGEHKIKFAQPGEKSLTVLLGENGSGKTTFLHACLWCLYGSSDFGNPEELAAYQALAQASPGSPVTVRVRISFDAEGGRYTAERALDVTRGEDGRLDSTEPDFHVSFTGANGETTPREDPAREIRRLLPKELAGFFFFKGEDLENLVAQSGADKLKSAVEEFIDLVLLDRSIRHLNQAEGVLEKRLKGQVSGRAKELSEQVQEVNDELSDLSVQDEREAKEKRHLLSQKEGVESELRKYQEIKPLVDRKRELEQQIEDLDSAVESKAEDVARVISRNGYLRLNPDVLNTGLRLANEAVEKGDLPAKIKPQFVDDLLDTGECICGRGLGADERQKLDDWRATSQLASLESAITGLRSDVSHLKTRAEQFEEDFETQRLKLAQLTNERQQLIAERSRIESELTEGDLGVDVVKLQTLLSELNDKLQDLSFGAGQRATRRQDLLERQTELMRLREKELKAKQKAKVTSSRVGAARNVSKALAKIRQGWISLVQQYLDKELKRNWKEMAQLDRLVQFDEQFRLDIKERGGDGEWVKSAPSSANQRALALGFVTSLIRLAADAGSTNSDSMLFAGGDYPLVMDAPFATMDTYFKRTIPAGLRKIVPQLVIASSLDQWDGVVEQVLKGAVGRVYVLELHGPEVETKTLEFEGQKIDYKVCEPDSTYDWTVLREVKR